MALIKCKECQKEISDKAKVCIHCGCPIEEIELKKKLENKKKFNDLSKEQKQYVYLEYLSNLGVSKEFLDKVSYIYTGKDNENPYELLDILTPYIGITNYNTYLKVRKK